MQEDWKSKSQNKFQFYVGFSSDLFSLTDVPTSAYQCNTGYCEPSYGRSVVGTSNDVAKACSNDHPKCQAYYHSAIAGYGYLCSSKNRTGSHGDTQSCDKYVKYNGNA